MGRDHPNTENDQPPQSSGDFGVPSEPASPDRKYASETVKQHSKGGFPKHAGEAGTRVAGVGGNASGRGSSSGGDVDTGADALAGLTDHHADPEPDAPTAAAASARKPLPPGAAQPLDAAGDVNFDGNTGAGNVNNPARDDDAFAGEITAEEATGQG